ncbi:MAG TPA: DUF2157 domain-containing protein [Ohtaekwangia sp.]|nr:DUF2157 domain-containing protein [Ohtaekwangia sp.]
MSKQLLKDLPELVQASVIDEATADRIRHHYAGKPDLSSSRLVIVFGVLGALLVGLGIILIIAHNWDGFGKTIKLGFALFPLLIGQLVCAFVLLRRPESSAWRESAATFLVMAVAAGISIVSQVYNIEGSLSGFLFIWMALTLPVIYIMRSSLASLIYICGITWYACELSYFHYPNAIAWWYWGFLAAALPYYYYLFTRHSRSNFFYFHSWLLAGSVTCVLGMFGDQLEELTVFLYMNAFAIFMLLGQLDTLRNNRLISNGFLIAGSLGTSALLLFLSFEGFWQEIFRQRNEIPSMAFNAYWLSLAIAIGLLILVGLRQSLLKLNLKSYAFIAAFILLLISHASPEVPRILVNILLFAFGVFTIRDGAHQNRLSILNYGLMIISALIVCRFFDTHMSFVTRGLLFVAVGAGFFVANYWMIRKRKNQSA